MFFGVMNETLCFQRKVDKCIDKHNLLDCIAYLDDVTICGNNIKEHNKNLNLFLETVILITL